MYIIKVVLALTSPLWFHAANRGHLPKSLEDVTIVPVPLNPGTERPFSYELNDGVATLTVAPPAGRPAAEGKKYVIRMEGN